MNIAEANIDISSLPLSMRELTGVIGVGAAFDLVEQYNGLRLYIPIKAKQEHEIATVIGFENMQKLCDHYFVDKNPLQLPKLDKVLIQLKHQTVLQMKQNMNTREISRQMGYTPRIIQQICSSVDEACDKNYDLFNSTHSTEEN